MPYATYVKNVRVLRRSQETTEPDPVTVVSDPSGKPVVVRVGDEYQWSGNLDGVTIWALGVEGEELSKMGTAKFENGNKLIVFDIVDEVNGNETYNHPYIVDENGYIRVTESVYQYYNVVGVEDGAIRIIQDSNGLESVADDGINQVSMLYFTTRAAAEEYYYSKVTVPVTVVSDPSGKPVVVQVGEEYQWNSTLDGVTLWGVWEDDEDGWIGATLKYENGMQKASIGLTDELGTNLEVNHPYIIDENGMIKVTEDTAFQYYQVIAVENGVITTADDSSFPLSDTSKFFTTRAAAEEYYYSKANPKSWMWFDHYPWVYSHKEEDWLYFRPIEGKLMYWSYESKVWREFNQ